ncbi:hypothetical protein KFU94_48050, partial [Chloroflexi bacterium TSY]|nr:hypothetical protein [Chloroflexi bacterium TSY]
QAGESSAVVKECGKQESVGAASGSSQSDAKEPSINVLAHGSKSRSGRTSGRARQCSLEQVKVVLCA